ncbi:FMRFamide receptor [Lingula anatina]|uniref:FMRFamide receptor n=1 Tax=Lingula anatina TaxID=7574 RepID=A0A1S3IRJ6_LINAN|nr:FMRFamide receptor [Lingula anatina]|eukprot:XP_013400832.1 FMRFamide receptor [Lingula anatina]
MDANSSCDDMKNVSSSSQDAGDIFAFVVDTVFVGSISFGGILVNAFTFLVLWSKRRQSTTFYFLLALAVADSLYLVHCLLFQVFRSIYPHTGNFKEYFDAWPYIEPYEYPFGMMSLTASIWLVSLMAFDRCLHLRFPFLFQKHNVFRHTKIEFLILVILDVGMNSAWFFRQRTVETWNACENVTRVEIIPYAIGESRSGRLAHTVVFLTFVYGLPLTVMTLANVLLIFVLRSHSEFHKALIDKTSTTKSRKPNGKSPSKSGKLFQKNSLKSSSGYVQGERRITAMLVVMIIIYLVCQTPVFVNHILYALEGKVDLGPNHRYFNVITNAMVALNSATNFFVYLIFVKGFRKRSRDAIASLCRTLRSPVTSCKYGRPNSNTEITETMEESHSHFPIMSDSEDREGHSVQLTAKNENPDREVHLTLLKSDEIKL